MTRTLEALITAAQQRYAEAQEAATTQVLQESEQKGVGMIWEYWQARTGEIYAVGLQHHTVVAAAGPLSYHEATAAQLQRGAFPPDEAVLQYVRAHETTFRLYEPPAVL